MWVTEKCNKNYQQAKEIVKYYRAELESQWSKNVKKIYSIKEIWKCRFLAVLWLYGLFWSIPVCLFLAVGFWIQSWNRQKISKLIPKDQRKTVLLTGASSTKGMLYIRLKGGST